MNFAAPLAFGLSALALPVIILYILKVKRRRVSVPYLRLWEALLVETKARSLFKRLKRFYSLLLQLLILAAVILALSDPALELSSVKKESIVLLLDCSASMQALEEDGETRYEDMLERAREIVEARSFEDEMMIAAISDRVDVLSSFNRNTLRLREALERVEPTTRSLATQRAYDFARSVTADRDHPVIIFLSDGAGGEVREVIAKGAAAAQAAALAAGVEPAAADKAETQERDLEAVLIPIGEAVENVGIVRFSTRKNSSEGTDYVLAVVRNFGEEDVSGVRLDLQLDGNSQKVLTLDIPAGEEVMQPWQLDLHAGGILSLNLEHEDALAIDNHAWAIVRPARLRKVNVIAPTSEVAYPFWVALLSMGEVISGDSQPFTTEEYAAASATDREADVTICIDDLPADLPRQGNLILVNTDLPDFLPARQTGVVQSPTVWDWDRDHMLNRFINYRDLNVPAARVIEIDQGEVLVESYDGPLISAFDMSDRMAIYVAFDIKDEHFTFRLPFPMLLRNAIAWFEVEEDIMLEASYAPGETIQPLRRLGSANVQVTHFVAGEEHVHELPLREGLFYFSETDEPGVYVFNMDGVPHSTCVNLFDPGESLVAVDRLDDEEDALSIEAGTHLLNRDLWGLLALGGLLLWVLEWAFYHRRITE